MITGVLLLVAACELKRPPFEIDSGKYGDVMNREAAGKGILIRKRAIDVYELQYHMAKDHKAMVQSTSGTWSWSHDQRSVDAAIDRALESCRRRNQSREASRPCQLINVDDHWIAAFSQPK